MSNNIKEDLGEELYVIVVKGLAEKLKSGEASYQDYKNAIDFLKNNGITSEPKKGTLLKSIQEETEKKFPFTPRVVNSKE